MPKSARKYGLFAIEKSEKSGSVFGYIVGKIYRIMLNSHLGPDACAKASGKKKETQDIRLMNTTIYDTLINVHIINESAEKRRRREGRKNLWQNSVLLLWT